MKRSLAKQAMFLLSILFAAVPFAFGFTRAVSTGDDVRYLWVAFACLFGVMTVMMLGKARDRTPAGVLRLAAVALLVSTLAGSAAAMLLGVRAGAGLLVVTVSFAFCSTMGFALAILARPRPEV